MLRRVYVIQFVITFEHLFSCEIVPQVNRAFYRPRLRLRLLASFAPVLMRLARVLMPLAPVLRRWLISRSVYPLVLLARVIRQFVRVILRWLHPCLSLPPAQNLPPRYFLRCLTGGWWFLVSCSGCSHGLRWLGWLGLLLLNSKHNGVILAPLIITINVLL